MVCDAVGCGNIRQGTAADLQDPGCGQGTVDTVDMIERFEPFHRLQQHRVKALQLQVICYL